MNDSEIPEKFKKVRQIYNSTLVGPDKSLPMSEKEILALVE
jgi:predicted RNase H-like nuclease (RuvC/YqgF family)